MASKGSYEVINRVNKYSSITIWSFWMWMQCFYEYSFSTAVIDADTQLAQTFNVPRSTCSSAKTIHLIRKKKSLTQSPILKTHSIRGDPDKTALSRNSRRKVGNDQETKQQNCHITVYHSEL